MSLIIAVYVPTGIALSGDSRTTATRQEEQPDPNNPTTTIRVQTNIVLSDAAEKIFLLKNNRIGVGTFGDAIVDNMPAGHQIEQYDLEQQAIDSPEEAACGLLARFRGFQPTPRVGLVVIGYHEGRPWVLAVDVHNNQVNRLNWIEERQAIDFGIARGGDSAVVKRLLSEPRFNPAFNVMSLQDAVDYSRHLIRSTIDQVRFEPRFPTVGGEIDTVVLTPREGRFLIRKELRAS
jgi:hypothetical protein